jgi:hypothetical protein
MTDLAAQFTLFFQTFQSWFTKLYTTLHQTILLSKIMCKNVDSVFIDESGKYDLHSDHVILSIQINDVHIPKKHSNGSNKFFWKIDEGNNWDAFQNNLKELFDEEWYTIS